MNELLIAAAVLILLLFIRAKYEIKTLRITKYKIESEKIPNEFHNSRFVLLSDLHNNEYGSGNETLLKKIRAEKPDYILIAGDMPVGRTSADNSTALSFVTNLAKEYPVYYANGNHEQRLSLYPETCDTTYREYTESLKKVGVRHLINQRASIIKNGESIDIIGLETAHEYYYKRNRPEMTREYLNHLIGKSKKERFQILLAHNPMFFEDYADWGADLVLSGHLHGGIIQIPFLGGLISPQLILFPKYDYGRFDEGSSTMILSGGLGTHTIRLRLLNKPEIVLFTLHKI